MSAKFTGVPKPEVKWSKVDGSAVEANDDITVDVDDRSTVLTMKNIQRTDSGDYTITVQNEAGIKAASAHVSVLGKNTYIVALLHNI